MFYILRIFGAKYFVIFVRSHCGTSGFDLAVRVYSTCHETLSWFHHTVLTKFSRLITKPTKHVRPAKTQISLGIAQSDQSLRCLHEECLGP